MASSGVEATVPPCVEVAVAEAKVVVLAEVELVEQVEQRTSTFGTKQEQHQTLKLEKM